MIIKKSVLGVSLLTIGLAISACKSTKTEVDNKVTQEQETVMANKADKVKSTQATKSQKDAFRRQMSEPLFARLKMSEEQQEKYFGIQDKYKPKMDKIRSNAKDKRDMINKVSELRTKQEKDIMSILSSEQQLEYTKYLSEPKKKKGGNRPH